MSETIDPGKGYRLLEVGEVIREGDEFWSSSDKKWFPTNHEGQTVKSYNCHRRRKISTLPREECKRIADAILNEFQWRPGGDGIERAYVTPNTMRSAILKHLPGGELEWELEPHVGSLCSGDYRIAFTDNGILGLEYCEPHGHWKAIEAGTDIDKLKAAAQEHADGNM